MQGSPTPMWHVDVAGGEGGAWRSPYTSLGPGSPMERASMIPWRPVAGETHPSSPRQMVVHGEQSDPFVASSIPWSEHGTSRSARGRSSASTAAPSCNLTEHVLGLCLVDGPVSACGRTCRKLKSDQLLLRHFIMSRLWVWFPPREMSESLVWIASLRGTRRLLQRE